MFHEPNPLPPMVDGVRIYRDFSQGSDEWAKARLGLLTASEMKHIISPKPEPETRVKLNGEPYKQREWNPIASNDKARSHLHELVAQRITQYVEPGFEGYDMLRGREDEIDARRLYAENYAAVEEVGFITREFDVAGVCFTLGYSPDALVGDDGEIEAKSRVQKYQVETIINNAVPDEHVIQVQTGLLVSNRKWCDFISYSGGLPMFVLRAVPDEEVQKAILLASAAFEVRIVEKVEAFSEALTKRRFIATERRVEQEMFA